MKKSPLILGIIFICISCSLIFFWQNLYGIQGTVEVAQIKIAPKITGYLTEFSLKPGDKTESGQELAAISRPQLEKELSEQSDALDEATMELEALKNTTYTEEKIITTAPAKTTVNNSDITFIIGGSNGVNEAVKENVQMLLSFSDMTFPHGLFRGILLEQIYRSFKILNNESYHK